MHIVQNAKFQLVLALAVCRFIKLLLLKSILKTIVFIFLVSLVNY